MAELHSSFAPIVLGRGMGLAAIAEEPAIAFAAIAEEREGETVPNATTAIVAHAAERVNFGWNAGNAGERATIPYHAGTAAEWDAIFAIG